MQTDTNTTKKSIKIETRFKGLNHYEDYLIAKHQKELRLYLFEKDFPDPIKRKIFMLYEKRVSRENIISLYTHTPMQFLSHLVHNTLDQLQTNTTTKKLN